MFSEIDTDFRDELFFRKIQLHKDDRGWFFELHRDTEPLINAIRFCQDNISVSIGKVVRGLHCQLGQWQKMTLIKGEIKYIALNLDKNSDAFGQIRILDMKSSEVNQVVGSPKIAHGFITISEETILNYKSSVYYGESQQFGISILPFLKKLNISIENYSISERDLHFPVLNLENLDVTLKKNITDILEITSNGK